MQQGWVRIDRSLMDHWLHEDKPYNRMAAWVDLILMANFEDKKININGDVLNLKRGQVATSLRYLSSRWGWSKDKVGYFLNTLESDGMITKNYDRKQTVLTLVNYGNYQDIPDKKKTVKRQSTDNEQTVGRQSTDNQQTVIGQNKQINKDNNENNENNDNKTRYGAEISEIISYLNEKTGRKYTGRSKSTVKYITARLKEGFTVEEFKQVIDNKVAAWARDAKMCQFLRPETLFDGRFETYLNDTETKAQKAQREKDELHERQTTAVDYDWLWNNKT